MNISRRNLVIFIVVIAVAAVVLIAVLSGRSKIGVNGGNALSSSTRSGVPVGVNVPGVGAKVSSNIAVPAVVVPAAVGGTTDAQFRDFNLTVSGGSFSPNTVIVNQNDNVKITFTAQDKSYDFTQPDYGLKQTLPQGKQAVVGFQANVTGKFTFYCSSCGGPSSGPVGYIIVK